MILAYKLILGNEYKYIYPQLFVNWEVFFFLFDEGNVDD